MCTVLLKCICVSCPCSGTILNSFFFADSSVGQIEPLHKHSVFSAHMRDYLTGTLVFTEVCGLSH